VPIQIPQAVWPSELTEEGPPQDASILLSGLANIGPAPHRVLAVRINPTTLAVDYRADLDESVYADYALDELVDDLTFLDDLDASVLVPMGGGDYVVWMMPFANLGEDED
jgi:hypothetical protein